MNNNDHRSLPRKREYSTPENNRHRHPRESGTSDLKNITNAVIPAKAGIWSRDYFFIRVTPIPGVYAPIMYWHEYDN